MTNPIAVVYSIRLKPGRAAEYITHYANMVGFMKSRGAIGSVIHQAEDGSLMIYSRWPDRATHQAAWPAEDTREAELPKDIFILSEKMKDCIAEKLSQKTVIVKQDCLFNSIS